MSVRGPWDLESPQGFGKRLRDTSFECKWRSGIHQNLGTDEGLGRKETIFGRAMTEVRDTGSYDNDSQELLQFYIKNKKNKTEQKTKQKKLQTCVKDAYLRARQKNSRTLLFFPFFDNFLINYCVVDYFHGKKYFVCGI